MVERSAEGNARASGRSPGERYALAQLNYPLVTTAVGMLMERQHLGEQPAFAVLEGLATTNGVDLDEASARVIFDM